MSIQAGSASAERSFSDLKRIHRYMRSTQGQEILNNLSIVSLDEGFLIDFKCSKKFYDHVLNAFLKKHGRPELISWTCKIFIVNEHHGFIKDRSTITNLIDYQHQIVGSFEDHLQVDFDYIDFSKAFDRINLRLSFKLKASHNRIQCVKAAGYCSQALNVLSDVLQGSYCGQLLFDLFINDIKYILKHNNFVMFADDFKLFNKTITCQGDILQLQDDLDRLGAAVLLMI